MNKVIIFTEHYPLSSATEGSFITPEIKLFKESFDEVIFVPCYDDFENFPPPILLKVRIIHILKNPNAVIKTMLSALKNRYSWYLCKEHLKVEIRLKYFKGWFSNFKEKFHLDDTSTLYYSFWLTQIAEFIGFIANENPKMICVSRAHRFDIFNFPETSIRKYGLMGLKAIYPCCRDGAAHLTNIYPLIAGRINVRYLGVEKLEQSLNPSPLNEDFPITFLSCHNLIARKRGLLSLSVLIKLAHRFKNIKFRWILIGGGEELSKILSLAKTAPLNLEVRFMGGLPNKRVHEIYAQEHIDFTLLLSASEGLPITLLESLAYGVPVVTCDVGGIGDAVTDGLNGVLFPKEIAVNNVVEKLIPYVECQTKREAMRSPAYNTFVKHFNAEMSRKSFVKELAGMLKKMVVHTDNNM